MTGLLCLHVLQSLDANELACLPGLVLVMSTAVTGRQCSLDIALLEEEFHSFCEGCHYV